MESLPVEQDGYTPSLEDDPALGLPIRAKMEILFAVMLGLFLGALDQTIERIDNCIALREKQTPLLTEWLSNQ